MTRRAWWLSLFLLLAAALAGWWYSPLSPRVRGTPIAGQMQRSSAATTTPATTPTHQPVTVVAGNCVLPPRVGDGGAPLQTPVPASLAPFQVRGMRLTPRAGFSLDAKVLSRRDYRSDREAAIAPTDLALGWGRMQDDAVLARLTITQSARWYRYRYGGEPPIPHAEIDRSAANMHLVAANPDIASAIARTGKGERVRIDGWLVDVRAPDGWTWRTSTTRDDVGQGACELIYVCAITRF